jgi:transcriptional regulator with XRE-family HTH domain
MMKDTIAPQIVENIIDEIAKKRKETGLSHQKLAELAQIDRSTISLIENKKRNPSFLIILKLCRALDISLAKILKKYEK